MASENNNPVSATYSSCLQKSAHPSGSISHPQNNADPTSPQRLNSTSFEQVTSCTRKSRTQLYENEILRIQISPLYKYQWWITITSHQGAEWRPRGLENAVKRGFRDMPYARLKKLRVEIQVPDKGDLGQMICLWNKVLDLVEPLEHADGLPSIEIHLLDTDHGKWVSDGEAQKTFPNGDDDDIEAILTPFLRLRKARHAEIIVDQEIKDPGGANFLYDVAVLMGRGESFPDGDPWSDQQIQNDQDDCWKQFDEDLDDLRGPTANMMRLKRFSSWFPDGLEGDSKYEDEWIRIDAAETAFDDRSSYQKMDSMDYRYRTMRSLNPLSKGRRILSGNVPRRLKGDPPFVLEDGWSKDEWHR